MKTVKRCIAVVLCAALLSGCSLISSGDDLLQTPRPSENFMLLQKQLEQIMGDTMTYVSPQGGEYRNTVTFEDIDGDSEKEAIAFLREGSGGKIYVYAFELEDGEYRPIGSIEAPGSALGSMSFLKIHEKDEGTGDKRKEKLIVLTWTLSGDLKQGMTVCAVQDGKLTEVLDATYTSYTMSDLDSDGSEELFTVTYDDAGRKTAQVYDYADNKMILLSQTDATQDVQTVANITQGKLDEDGRQAVFVDNKFENDNGMQTDIYVLDKTRLRNVALSANASTYRSVSLYYSQDIDGDGIIEVPQLQPMPGYENSDATQTLWMVDWYRYSMNGATQRMLTTYDSLSEGWTFRLPKEWRGAVTATTTSEAGVSQTTFMQPGQLNDPLLTIYVFTGEDREAAAGSGGLIALGSTVDTCFAAKLGHSDSSYQISEDEAVEAFSVVQSEWK
ncbi:MAG: hypothetical protein ACI3X2_11880 [Butyricicoccus porcorum]